MMRGARSTFHTGVLILVAGVVGACDNTAGLESIEDLALRDMALVAADETLEIVNTWGQPYSFGGAPAATAAMPGIGGFGQPGGRLGLGAEGSGTVSETFYDENGVEQADYDELTTERIDVEVIVEGEVARDDWSASVYRERQMTITGLLGEETHRTHNGTGSMETHGSHHTDDGDREYVPSGMARPWNWDRSRRRGGFGRGSAPNVAPDLARALTRNPRLEVLLVNGIYDLATPYFAAVWTMDNLNLPPDLRDNIERADFAAGHMMYVEESLLEQWRRTLSAFILRTSGSGAS